MTIVQLKLELSVKNVCQYSKFFQHSLQILPLKIELLKINVLNVLKVLAKSKLFYVVHEVGVSK